MKQTEQEKTLQMDPELDTVLAQMAEDVPPMPADFHEKWMNAIRTDMKETSSAPEGRPEKSPVSLIRWTRILSVAAAFIFLIGGTVLYRNSKRTLSPVSPLKDKTDMITGEEAPAAGEETEAAAEEDTAQEDTAAGNTVAEEADYNAAPALFMNAMEGEEAEDVYIAAPKADSASMAMLSAEGIYEAAEDDLSAESGDPAEIYEEAEGFVNMEVPGATLLPDALQAESAGETEEAETPEEPETGLLQNMGVFLADMGGFLLAALPYLAVLAVPAIVAAVIRRKKRQSAG